MLTAEQVRLTLATFGTSPRANTFKNIALLYFAITTASRLGRILLLRGPTGILQEISEKTKRSIFRLFRMIPSVQNKIQTEVNKTLKDMEHSVISNDPEQKKYLTLPEMGLDEQALRSELQRYRDMGTIDWTAGQISGTIYHAEEKINELSSEAYAIFSQSNPLHADIFPGVRQMEAEVISMVLNMYNAPSDAGGAMTSGGTESILMACRAYREMGRELKGITEPEMIVPVTGHAAFDKAADYFGIRLVHVPVDKKTWKVDIKAVKRAINWNTVMIVGSAIGFPHGIIDDVPELAKIAVKYNIPLHVDCCLGGFLLPFMEKAGFTIPPFDFRVPGVTSISCDTHKYGFAPKGSSVIMYASKKTRQFQYFVAQSWTGGIYASPTIPGSRPGALVAGCWTAMTKMGLSGYVDSTQRIVQAAQEIKRGVLAMEDLFVFGDPLVSVVAFGSHNLNIYAINDAMSSRGWSLNALQNPPAMHIACTLATVPTVDQFLKDLADSVAQVKNNPSQDAGSTAAMYGSAATIPDKSILDDVVKGYLDCLYKA
ncbi:PLP-dependent transferase [Basidiobolus meristosporus CBS 931.73]|uniref:sphinganine-1-phosphate aldolase n=1 Tax=Basidiobolus meristosporus CBS 931.73 TaxID=1314790 RepID=A0A1Y1XNE5_9FUNG|nr:PLP-dependent transferase [Basidiobolus meristosporus CBS 931.73]|eukprot:ORX87269.1 PLP-dependent transferase [Basidiobolus meristosporus CBS 931.73]